jgi:hypothetical protein
MPLSWHYTFASIERSGRTLADVTAETHHYDGLHRLVDQLTEAQVAEAQSFMLALPHPSV